MDSESEVIALTHKAFGVPIGFLRGIATNLHQLGVADKDIQAILRHSNIGITMNIYVKSVAESQVDAMDLLGEEFEKQQFGKPSQQKLHVN